MEVALKFFIAWLHLHPMWAGVVTFITTFLESLAIIGLLIPGSVTLTAIGGLIGSGIVPAGPIFIWAILGGIAGDVLSYWFGYHYHEAIKNRWPFSRFPKLIAKGEKFFDTHGSKGLFIGRFIGAMRPILPLIAGMLRFSRVKFIIVETTSAILWAPLYMLPGILIGAASNHFAPDKALNYILVLLGTILAIWLLFVLGRLFLNKVTKQWQQFMQHYWLKLKENDSALYHYFSEFTEPDSPRPLTILLFVLLASLLFIVLSIAVATQADFIININTAILSFFETLNASEALPFAVTIQSYSSSIVITLGAIVTIAYLLLKQNKTAVILFIDLLLSAIIVVLLFPFIFRIAPPDVVLNNPLHYSYPCDAIVLTTAILGYVAFLINTFKYRVITYFVNILCGVALFFIMLAQFMLNIYWFSDILAGFMLGLILLGITLVAYRHKKSSSSTQPWLVLIVFLLTIAISGSIYYAKKAPQETQAFTLKSVTYYVDVDTWWQSPAPILPLYRTNRLNQPVEFLNLQWLADLDNIRHLLEKDGWQIAANFNLANLKQQFINNDLIILSPFNRSFQRFQPVLVMVKPDVKKGGYFILRLWDINYHTELEPIYIGNITYRAPGAHWYSHKLADCDNQYNAPLNDLVSLLPKDEMKVILLPKAGKRTTLCQTTDNKILLIKGD